ncbi:hypothetical protein ACT8ZS_05950 [Paenibacillus sp. M.A.Huq-84]
MEKRKCPLYGVRLITYNATTRAREPRTLERYVFLLLQAYQSNEYNFKSGRG